MAERKRRIRVLLVDDHPSVLEGLRAYLKRKNDIRVIGQALDGIEAVQKAKKLLPDVVVLDLSLPRVSGFDALTRIRGENQAVRFVVYTMHEGGEFIQEARRVGASGYVLKTSAPSVLVRAIEEAKRGMSFFDCRISNPLSSLVSDDLKSREEAEPNAQEKRNDYSLTPREQGILKFISDGLTLKEIAERLHVSYNTVINHERHIREKVQVHTRGAVVAKALRENLI